MREKAAPQLSWVTAVFQGAVLSFDLAREATLAQLAEQLGTSARPTAACSMSGWLPKNRTPVLNPLEFAIAATCVPQL